jgi:dTDP-3-amino-3,4,6-trideoxy-alpha-D-glucose transaminase
MKFDVPLLRLDNADPELLDELMGVVHRVASTGAFTLGHELEAFELDYAVWSETGHAVGVSSGTEAITLALKALEIGAGDEVIVPANSFIATAEGVALAGAVPCLVDVDPETQLMTAEGVAQHIGPRTRAVIPVHLYGQTVDMDPIVALAREHGLAVIEDTAQAHGARYRGRRVGTLGDIGCYSFYPTKNLGAWGDGGAITTDDAELAERVRLLRSHGEKPRYHHRVIGTTARLDALQAAILRAKLPRLEAANEGRRRAAALLCDGLAGSSVELQQGPGPHGDHVYHLFVVRSDEREALRAHLSALGVASAVHYPIPIHRTEAFAHLGLGPGSLPVSEDLAERIVTLPMWPTMTVEQVETVVDAVHSFRPTSTRTRRFARSAEAPVLSGRSS